MVHVRSQLLLFIAFALVGSSFARAIWQEDELLKPKDVRRSVLTGAPLKGLPVRRQLAYNASEERTTNQVERYMESIRDNRALLTAFVNQMPKGGDIHLHYSGALYAEGFLKDALAANFLYCPTTALISPSSDNSCTWVPLQDTVNNNTYMTIVKPTLLQRWSVYNYLQAPISHEPNVPYSSLQSPADHFFVTFGLFGPVSKFNVTRGMQELKNRAISENLSYLELMFSSGSAVPFNNQDAYQKRMWEIQAAQDEKALMDLLNEIYTTAVNKTAQAQATQRYIQGIQDANQGMEESGFRIRYQSYATRTQPPAFVFGQLITGFDACNSSNLVVGVNIVAQENDEVSLRDFWLHMRFFKFLKTIYPNTKLAIHAGEMVLGMVEPELLRFHVHDSVLVAGANRIGHGVDIGWENNNTALLDYMNENEVVLEINLSSNSFILGANADLHPNSVYLDSGVPCVISSDDPGILRGSISEEYIRLINSYKYITYSTIKDLVRNSIKYSFIKEASLKASILADLELRFKKFEQAIMVGVNVQEL